MSCPPLMTFTKPSYSTDLTVPLIGEPLKVQNKLLSMKGGMMLATEVTSFAVSFVELTKLLT